MSPLRPVFTSRALLLVGALCAAGGVAAQTQEPAPAPVSYTHLTLPTSDLV